MLLSIWANFLSKQKPVSNELRDKFIFAGLGKPTYPINLKTIQVFKEYWENIEKSVQNWSEEFGEDSAAVGYGDPYGDAEAKTFMAKAMSSWYASPISAENIIFTVGGIGGLRTIFEVLNGLYAESSKYRVITPFPYYSAYANNPKHVLHPIEVMSEKGYRLTAKALEKSIDGAYELAVQDGIVPKAILICNPSNPLGTTIKKQELTELIEVLRKYPDLYLIFDEAYAEMSFTDMPSFLNIAPDLKHRTIILRSATKALSAAGERMAVILAFDDYFINELVKEHITSYVHAPTSAQLAYAKTMLTYTDNERKKMASYYQEKVKYVVQRLKTMGAEMPCSEYEVEATFYVMGDFSDLLGMEMPENIKAVFNHISIAQTGEDLAYYLLFKDSLMVAPLSYFGLAQDCGYLRITCSANFKELEEMMNRLEQRLFEARLKKKDFLLEEITTNIKNLPSAFSKNLYSELNKLNSITFSCHELKEQNQSLTNLLYALTEDSLSQERVF